jgi:hypothetical protein
LIDPSRATLKFVKQGGCSLSSRSLAVDESFGEAKADAKGGSRTPNDLSATGS